MAKTKRKRSIEARKLKSQIIESYKIARTNIISSITKDGCKKIVFTSPSQEEDKAITIMNVAVALAQQLNTRVLLLECDLRHPQIHSMLKLSPTPGLTNYLNKQCSAKEIIRPTKFSSLDIVCCGGIPNNPSELLASKNMSDFIEVVEKYYDYIVFDTPSVGVVLDAVSLMKISDGVVVVVKNEMTTYPALNKILEIIKRSGSNTLGVIVNNVKL